MHKIIDFHSHLGDIFAYQKNVTWQKNAKLPEGYRNPFDDYSQKGFKGPLLDPNDPKQIEDIINATRDVCWNNTLENVSREFDENSVDYTVMLPIMPWISFEEYLAAARVEPRIIPFTSADFRLSGEEAGKKVVEDAFNGAKGLKIHPVLQPVNLNDPKMEAVLTAWETTGLPVISHCGINDYYPPEMDVPRCPQNANLPDFIVMVKRFPNINFVSAHAGGLTGGEMEELADQIGDAPNLYVDTTFRNVGDMKKMVRLFGEDKVIFGNDRPFANIGCSLAAAFEAYGKGTPLSEKIMFTNAAKLMKMI